MDSLLAPAGRTKRPVLYGALVAGALATIIVTGWLLFSPSLLFQRQVASATAQRDVPASSPPQEDRSVRGRVLDAESGAPLAGASVWIGPAELRTDEEGRFVTEPVKPGSAFFAKAPGYEGGSGFDGLRHEAAFLVRPELGRADPH